MEAESSVVRFAQDVSAGHVHSGSVAHQVIPAGGGMIHPSMGALLARFGMAPAGGTFPPGMPPASAVYGAGAANAPRNPWNGVMMAGQPGAGGGNGERAAPQLLKGPWTAEEDEFLKNLVREHGERKWAVIARCLPGRIGKQCRERWTNHLRPGIKKSIWTELDDLALIEAHKVYGNRWSTIAKFIPGRSENAVKNHWNATKRSLKAKRRLKKKNAQAAYPVHLSFLEQYIRSVYPAAADLSTAPPPVSPPLYNLGNGGVASPTPAATLEAGLFEPAVGMGLWYLNSGGGGSSSASPPSSNSGAAMNNMNLPQKMLDLNTYYGEVPLHAVKPPQVMMDHYRQLQQQQQQASSYANMMTGYPFVDNFMWQQPSVLHAAGPSNANIAGPQYYGAGGGSADDVDVVQMASREFLMPSQGEATFDLARFM